LSIADALVLAQSFSNEKRAQVKEENPDIPVTEIMKKLGEMWKAIDAEEKKVRVFVAVVSFSSPDRFDFLRAEIRGNGRKGQGTVQARDGELRSSAGRRRGRGTKEGQKV
jgi:hypothetical protein